MSQPKPDFVIAGAAKAGTSALFEYLAQHPAVFVPTLKEPAFFCPDLPGGISTIEEYRALFDTAPPHSIAGEASTRYLLSKVAIELLIAYNPRIKVIVMLRNPVDAAYSLHGYAYRYGHENIADFERAWRAQSLIDRTEAPPRFEYLYDATYRYAGQVRRVLDHVPESQRLFLIYEEFFAEPAKQFFKVIDFLGLAPFPQIDFSIVNEYLGVKSPALEGLARRLPNLPGLANSPLRPLLRALGRPALSAMRTLNWNRREKTSLRAQFRTELEQHFAADVAQLEHLLHRKLWWNQSESPSAV